MLENQISERPERHPVMNLILILILVGLGFVFVGPFIGFFLAMPFYPGSMTEMVESLQNPMGNEDLKVPLYIIQAFATLIGLIVVPVLYLAREQKPVSLFFKGKKIEIIPLVVVVILTIVFMVVNSIFIEWNSNIDFPSFLDGFERWAREQEDQNAELTKFLTNFTSGFEVCIALLVIAVLPAIGEELVFRGLIQNELWKATKNPHVAIWIAAVLFSAIHLQFYGFIPRMLLGALFGYLYYWSGSLSMAILAHFVNNGFSIITMYFYQQGSFEFDPESPEALPANVVVIAILATGGLLYFFYKHFEHRKPALPQL